MHKLRILGIYAALAFAAASAVAQGVSRGLPQAVVGPVASAIGPNGTYYALLPGTGSTPQAPVRQLVAFGPVTAPAQLWVSSNLTGDVSTILPGANTVFAVETTTSGSGKSTTVTTSILLFAAATGSTSGLTTVTPTGQIDDIQVKTINGSDYLYVVTVETSTSTSGGTTTVTTTRTLTIYSQTGAVLGKPVAL